MLPHWKSSLIILSEVILLYSLIRHSSCAEYIDSLNESKQPSNSSPTNGGLPYRHHHHHHQQQQQQYTDQSSLSDYPTYNQWGQQQVPPDLVPAALDKLREASQPKKKSILADSSKYNHDDTLDRAQEQGLRSLYEVVSGEEVARHPEETIDHPQKPRNEDMYLSVRSRDKGEQKKEQQAFRMMKKPHFEEESIRDPESMYRQQQARIEDRQTENQRLRQSSAGNRQFGEDENRSFQKKPNEDEDESDISEVGSIGYDGRYLDDDRIMSLQPQHQVVPESRFDPTAENAYIKTMSSSSQKSVEGDEDQFVRPQEVEKRNATKNAGAFYGNRKSSSALSKTDLAIEYLKNILRTKQNLLREATAHNKQNHTSPLMSKLLSASNSSTIKNINGVGEQKTILDNIEPIPTEFKQQQQSFYPLQQQQDLPKEEIVPLSQQAKFSAIDAFKADNGLVVPSIQKTSNSYEKQLMHQSNGEYRRNNQFIPILTTKNEDDIRQSITKPEQKNSGKEPVYQYPNEQETNSQEAKRPPPPPINSIPFESYSNNGSETSNKDSVEKLHQTSVFPHISHGTPLGGDYVENLDDSPRGLRSMIQSSILERQPARYNDGTIVSDSRSEKNEKATPETFFRMHQASPTSNQSQQGITPSSKTKDEYKSSKPELLSVAGQIDSRPQFPTSKDLLSNATMPKEVDTVKKPSEHNGSKSPQIDETVKPAESKIEPTQDQSKYPFNFYPSKDMLRPVKMEESVVAVKATQDKIESHPRPKYVEHQQATKGESMETKETKANYNYHDSVPDNSETELYGPNIQLGNTLYGLNGAEHGLTNREVEAIRQQLFLQPQPKEHSGNKMQETSNDYSSSQDGYIRTMVMEMPTSYESVDTLNQHLHSQEGHVIVPDEGHGNLNYDQKSLANAQSEPNSPNYPQQQEMQPNYQVPGISHYYSRPSHHHQQERQNYPRGAIGDRQQYIRAKYPQQQGAAVEREQNYAPKENQQQMTNHHPHPHHNQHHQHHHHRHHHHQQQQDRLAKERHNYSEQPQHQGIMGHVRQQTAELNHGYQADKNTGVRYDKSYSPQASQHPEDMKEMASFVDAVRGESKMPMPVGVGSMEIRGHPPVLVESLKGPPSLEGYAGGADDTLSNQQQQQQQQQQIDSLLASSSSDFSSSLSNAELQKAIEDINKSAAGKVVQRQQHQDNGHVGPMISVTKLSKHDSVALKKQHYTTNNQDDKDSKKKSLIVYLNHPRLEDVSGSSPSSGGKHPTNNEGYGVAQPLGLEEFNQMPDLTRIKSGSNIFGDNTSGVNKTSTSDGDGLSVVVVGDAHKYKKIVLLISSKSGGLKLLPIVKDMRRRK